eukprot:UN03594
MILSDEPKSQHLLTFGKYLLPSGHFTSKKWCFLVFFTSSGLTGKGYAL